MNQLLTASGHKFTGTEYPALLKQAAKVLRAINHPLRLKIMEYIITQSKATVNDISIQFRMEQPVISMHLSHLRKAGFISFKTQDKFHFYYINTEKLNQVNHAIKTLCSNQYNNTQHV